MWDQKFKSSHKNANSTKRWWRSPLKRGFPPKNPNLKRYRRCWVADGYFDAAFSNRESHVEIRHRRIGLSALTPSDCSEKPMLVFFGNLDDLSSAVPFNKTKAFTWFNVTTIEEVTMIEESITITLIFYTRSWRPYPRRGEVQRC